MAELIKLIVEVPDYKVEKLKRIADNMCAEDRQREGRRYKTMQKLKKYYQAESK